MAFMFVLGQCCNCHKMFSFNADLVPSVQIKGTKEPICKDCVEWANPLRKQRNLAEIYIPPGAYEAQEVF